MAAGWGLVSVVNKRLLEDVHPVPLNMLVRLVAIAGLVLTTVPLTLTHAWPYGFGIDLTAFLYIAVSATVTWLVAFTAYYYALRAGQVGVVTPLSSTDPLWAALFSLGLIGTALHAATLIGMAITIAGVVLISRSLSETGGALTGPADGAVVPPLEESAPAERDGRPAGGPEAGGGRPAAARTAGGGALTVVGFSLLAAAGWGLAPVLVQLAEQSYGGPSAFMMLESQALGALALGAWVLWRRSPVLARPLGPAERRRMLWLLLASGGLETMYAVLFYLVIDQLGAVLAMLLSATAPVFGVFAGMLVLKERMSARLALAVALTLAGVFVATAARLF